MPRVRRRNSGCRRTSLHTPPTARLRIGTTRSFSSTIAATSASQALWQDLYDAGADVILNGHAHVYERFAPQTPSGALDTANGIREFVVGTGGAALDAFSTIAPNSQARNNTTFGVLKLTLHPTGYDWAFTPGAGGTFTDSGWAPVTSGELAAGDLDSSALTNVFWFAWKARRRWRSQTSL